MLTAFPTTLYSSSGGFSLITSGLQARWNFAEGSGSTTADESGNSNTATLTNGPTFSTTTPFGSGYSMSFDGTNDYLSVAHSSSLNITGNISMCAWVRPNTSGASYPMLITKGPINTGYLMFLNGGAVHFRLRYSPSDIGVVGATALSANTWYHVVAWYDGTNARVYINAAQDVTGNVGSVSLQSNTDTLGIGGRESNYFNGRMADVRLYNRALTTTEISSIYAGTG